MAFNPDVKRKIVRDKEGNRVPCVMCGVRYPLPDAVHIVDEKEWKAVHSCDRQINGIPLCPNCHRVFDEVLRPYLYRALSAFGATGLPKSWAVNNKLTVTEQPLDFSDDSQA
jgi:predicted restriction endonuclease